MMFAEPTIARPQVGDKVKIKGAWGAPPVWATLTKELVYGVDHYWTTNGGGSWLAIYGNGKETIINLNEIIKIEEKTK